MDGNCVYVMGGGLNDVTKDDRWRPSWRYSSQPRVSVISLLLSANLTALQYSDYHM